MRKIKKTALDAAVKQQKNTYQSAFQSLWNEINQGQQKKILRKHPEFKDIFDLFGVEYEV